MFDSVGIDHLQCLILLANFIEFGRNMLIPYIKMRKTQKLMYNEMALYKLQGKLLEIEITLGQEIALEKTLHHLVYLLLFINQNYICHTHALCFPCFHQDWILEHL